MSITFIKVGSLSVTITWRPSLDVIKRHLSLSRAQVKLFCLSLDKNANVAEKVNPVDITPTISSKGNQYFLVL